ncbi:MAG: hypothetical protein ABIA21_00100 [Candidatus Aenigmatarchaeota archaeon]
MVRESGILPRKPKYAKTQIETWKCASCEHVWYYATIKCPLCYSQQTLRIN